MVWIQPEASCNPLSGCAFCGGGYEYTWLTASVVNIQTHHRVFCSWDLLHNFIYFQGAWRREKNWGGSNSSNTFSKTVVHYKINKTHWWWFCQENIVVRYKLCPSSGIGNSFQRISRRTTLFSASVFIKVIRCFTNILIYTTKVYRGKSSKSILFIQPNIRNH